MSLGEKMNTNDLVIFTDLHSRNKSPYKESKEDFISWLVDDPKLNNESNVLLILGDLGDLPKLPGNINNWILDMMHNRFKFKQIIILTGNHDSRRKEGNYLDMLRHIPKVKIVDRMEELDIGEISTLLLPHYIVQRDGDVPMKKYYESLQDDPELLK